MPFFFRFEGTFKRTYHWFDFFFSFNLNYNEGNNLFLLLEDCIGDASNGSDTNSSTSEDDLLLGEEVNKAARLLAGGLRGNLFLGLLLLRLLNDRLDFFGHLSYGLGLTRK